MGEDPGEGRGEENQELGNPGDILQRPAGSLVGQRPVTLAFASDSPPMARRCLVWCFILTVEQGALYVYQTLDPTNHVAGPAGKARPLFPNSDLK